MRSSEKEFTIFTLPNAPCLPPKILHKDRIRFSWDDCNTQGKSETGYVKFCGLKQGVLWSLSKFASCM